MTLEPSAQGDQQPDDSYRAVAPFDEPEGIEEELLHFLNGGLGTAVLIGITSALMLDTEPIVAPNSIGMLGCESSLGLPWLVGAISWTRLTLRDWIVTLAVLAFAGLNFLLWSLPISQAMLFLISLPLGVVAFAAFMWFAPRK